MRRNLIVIFFFLSISSWAQDFELIEYKDIGVTQGKMKTSDLNIDGILDLVISGTADNGITITTIFSMDTLNGLIQEHQLPGFEDPEIILSDLNNDGFNDILISGLMDGLESYIVYRNERNFQFSNFGNWANFKGNVQTADLDNNGKVDILASGFERNNDILNNIWIQNTSGFTLRDSAGFESIGDFEILDYNGDNFPDILVATGEQGGVVGFQILENDGWANFKTVDPNITGYIDPRISKGDFSQNGEMDLLIGGERGSGYFVDLFTNEAGIFTLSQSIQFESEILDLISVDITNDGIMDGIVLTANSVILLKGQIDSFEEVGLLDSLSGGSIAIGDFDRDYDQDLFISGERNESLSIWILKNLKSANVRPSRPELIKARLTTEGFIIHWGSSFDDTTPSLSLSYKIILKEDTLLANGTNWTISEYGEMELGTDYVFRDLQPGFYEIWIIAQDNSLITEFESPFNHAVTGMCNSIPGPGLCAKYGISPRIEICKGDSLEPISVPGGYEVTWYSQEQDSIGVYDSIPFQTDKDDVLYVTYTDPEGCKIYWFQEISVIEPSFEVSLIDNVGICKGDELLEAELGSIESEVPLPFYWSLLGSDSTIVPLVFPYAVQNDGTILVTIEDTTLCEFSYPIQLRSYDRPFISAGDDITLVLGESIQLEATPGLDKYEWEPPEGLSSTSSPNPVCTPTIETLYTVTGYNGDCSSQDQILVSVIREIFVPNLFSPNNDGNNDTFKVYGDGLKELTLQIFTNSGSLIYESTDISEIQKTGWDGSSKGNPMPSGVYFWSVTGTFQNGQIVSVDGRNSGLVTLVR